MSDWRSDVCSADLDFAVLQRLHKLVESRAKLPSNAQQKHADLLHVIQWEPPEDRSDEFAVYISSGPAPDEPTVALLNFKAMEVDAFIDWGMSQVGEPWECGGGGRAFVNTDPRDRKSDVKGKSVAVRYNHGGS